MLSHFVGQGNPLNKAMGLGEELRGSEVETSWSKASISFCDSPVCILKRPEALPSQILNYSSLVQSSHSKEWALLRRIMLCFIGLANPVCCCCHCVCLIRLLKWRQLDGSKIGEAGGGSSQSLAFLKLRTAVEQFSLPLSLLNCSPF